MLFTLGLITCSFILFSPLYFSSHQPTQQQRARKLNDVYHIIAGVLDRGYTD